MRRAAALAAAAAVGALGAAGCGGAGEDGATAPTRTVEHATRVEVVRAIGAGAGAFDPQGLYERESPGVVTVLSSGFDGTQGGGGLGSGFVLDGAGEIATNAHVVTMGEGASIRQAGRVYVRFADHNQVPAHVVGFDPFSDVALLRIDPTGLTLRPLPLGSVADVHVGEPVAAIGSPFGEESSLSVGVISATGRSIQSLTGFQTAGALQTDAAINSGNSGGPLLDARGRVLGINSQIQTRSGANSGVGFAVPVDIVRRSLAQLRRTGKARYAYLGIATSQVYPQLAARFGLGTDHGAWVQTVVGGGPGDDAGLRAGGRGASFQEQRYLLGGDVVVAVDGQELHDDDDLGVLLATREPGTTVTLRIVRDGAPREVRVRLGTRPLESPQG